MTRRFVSALERYAQSEGVDLIRFDRGERTVMRAHLRICSTRTAAKA